MTVHDYVTNELDPRHYSLADVPPERFPDNDDAAEANDEDDEFDDDEEEDADEGEDEEEDLEKE